MLDEPDSYRKMARKAVGREGETSRGYRRVTSPEEFCGGQMPWRAENPKSVSSMKQGCRARRGLSPQGSEKGRRGMAIRVEPSQHADSLRLSAGGAENLMGGAPW
jgi:hypothetical protein